VAVGLAVAFWALSLTSAAAQQIDPNGIVISTNSGTPLLVDGLESEKLPANASAGQTVCTPDQRMYKSEGERWIFKQWSTGETSDCIKPGSRGTYRAIYAHEVLLLLKSTAPGVQRSQWVAYGAPFELKVPEVVAESDGTRNRFAGWSDGESPFDVKNTIAPVKPMAIEVKWTREHYLQVEGTNNAEIRGTGWYADGQNVVLRAAETLPGESDQQRWKFSEWESTSFPAAVIQNPKNATVSFAMSGPYSVRANYVKQYLVQATSPFGTLKRDWINEGEEVVLEAPPLLDVVPEQERLVFKRWEGMDGLLSPKISGKADRPININAVYDRQLMLKVSAQHGATGDGWQKAGSVVTVTVPASVTQMFLLKSSFLGFGGYPAGQPTVQVLLNEPTTLAALYRTELDYPLVALVIEITIAVGVIVLGRYRGWRWSMLRRELKARVAAVSLRMRRRVPAPDEPFAADQTIYRNGVEHLPQPLGDHYR